MSLFEQSQINGLKKVLEFKKACEANIVSILWKEPESFFQHDIVQNDFTNNCWKVYFTIGYEVHVKQQKTLNDINVGLYLNEHPKLEAAYDEYGGWNTIDKSKKYVDIKNLEAYIKQNNKWKMVINLAKNNFSIEDRIKDFVDMSTDEIYDYYESKINHLFGNVEGDEEAYSIAHKIDETFEKLDQGEGIGLPFFNSPILTKETSGNLFGNITLSGALSGVGKSSFTRNVIIPSIISHKEKIVMMINEEDYEKVQRELAVWVANNIFKIKLQKHTVKKGKYTDETKEIIEKAKKWIKDNEECIRIITFKSFNTSKVIKVIKKYSALGVKYFILDTFKADQNHNDETYWLNMKNNMVKIYDTVKPANKNVHIWITFQLANNSSKQRYFTQENIGESKSILHTASTCLMIRNVFQDEYESGKKQISVYAIIEGKEVHKVLSKDKHYQIVFIIKNREGSANNFQVVIEHDLSTNTYREVGICYLSPDF